MCWTGQLELVCRLFACLHDFLLDSSTRLKASSSAGPGIAANVVVYNINSFNVGASIQIQIFIWKKTNNGSSGFVSDCLWSSIKVYLIANQIKIIIPSHCHTAVLPVINFCLRSAAWNGKTRIHRAQQSLLNRGFTTGSTWSIGSSKLPSISCSKANSWNHDDSQFWIHKSSKFWILSLHDCRARVSGYLLLFSFFRC